MCSERDLVEQRRDGGVGADLAQAGDIGMQCVDQMPPAGAQQAAESPTESSIRMSPYWLTGSPIQDSSRRPARRSMVIGQMVTTLPPDRPTSTAMGHCGTGFVTGRDEGRATSASSRRRSERSDGRRPMPRKERPNRRASCRSRRDRGRCRTSPRPPLRAWARGPFCAALRIGARHRTWRDGSGNQFGRRRSHERHPATCVSNDAVRRKWSNRRASRKRRLSVRRRRSRRCKAGRSRRRRAMPAPCRGGSGSPDPEPGRRRGRLCRRD